MDTGKTGKCEVMAGDGGQKSEECGDEIIKEIDSKMVANERELTQ